MNIEDGMKVLKSSAVRYSDLNGNPAEDRTAEYYEIRKWVATNGTGEISYTLDVPPGTKRVAARLAYTHERLEKRLKLSLLEDKIYAQGQTRTTWEIISDDEYQIGILQ